MSSIEVVFTPEFAKAVAAFDGTKLEKAAGFLVVKGFRKMANTYRRHIRAALKPHRKTGRMSSNIRVKEWGRGIGTTVGVKSTGSGSNLIVGGVQPHAIAPGGIMPLWAGKGKSASIQGFARAVMHPGFPADPFFVKGMTAAQGEVVKLRGDIVDQLAHDLARRAGKR